MTGSCRLEEKQWEEKMERKGKKQKKNNEV